MSTLTNNIDIPSHVPPGLVIPFSVMASPEMAPTAGARPYDIIQKLHQGPRVFYSPAIGRMLEGNWVLTRNEDMQRVLKDTVTFSSAGIAGFSHLLGETWDMIPLEVDPPEHDKYRTFFAPMFTPPAIKHMSDNIRQVCNELLDDIKAKQSCEFIEDFARRFPVRIFMDLMGMPAEDYETILQWEEMILHSPDMAIRAQGAHAIRDYLVAALAARKGCKKNDVLSRIANGEADGKALTNTEQLSMSLFLFVAGLDTVASSLGYVFRYLAENPHQQTWLLADTRRIPTAVEELMRAFSVVITSRRITQDVEIAGVSMKQGDSVSLPLPLGNYDENAFSNAHEIQLDRKPNAHIAFTVGPHRCLGTHLARREICIAIEECLRRLPNLAIRTGTQPIARGGAVMGVDEMHLVWG